MQIKDTFVHHVHFWLKNKADLPKLIEGLNILASISHVRDIHIGIPADTHRSVVERSYDASLLIFFDNLAEQDAYQIDPTHEIFVNQYAGPLCERVVVTDAVNV
jgi:hypothetical protein